MKVLRQRAGEEQRATALELFFDLAFVFAVISSRTRIMGALLTVLGALMVLQTLFWRVALR